MVVQGAIGGLFAGAVVAVWFLILDLLAGDPFRTPASLARALLGPSALASEFRLVALYTVLHFTMFGMLGALAGYLLRITDAKPGWLVGALFGISVIDAVHYGALILTGAEVIAVLPPLHVVTANVLGGVVMMTYLHRALAVESRLGVFAIKNYPLLTQGLVTGFIGAATVALWFLALDVAAGEPLRTPAALGSLVFLGVTTPADVSLHLGIVGGYTLLHLLVFGIVGMVAVIVARLLRRAPHDWIILLQAFITLEAVSIPVLGLLGLEVLGSGALWRITVANLLAVLAMGLWIWRTSPRLRRQLAAGGSAAG
jgi:hypothetical protein